VQPENPSSHMVLGVALSQLDQDDAIDEFKFALNTDLAEFNTPLPLITGYHKRKPHDFEGFI